MHGGSDDFIEIIIIYQVYVLVVINFEKMFSFFLMIKKGNSLESPALFLHIASISIALTRKQYTSYIHISNSISDSLFWSERSPDSPK